MILLNGPEKNLAIMKLAAIYNIFDGCELLPYSVNSIKNDVDLIIVVYQRCSNFGEVRDPLPEIEIAMQGLPVIYKHFHPTVNGGFHNEKAKRNIGIQIALQEKCTHFIHLDCDEMYENFFDAKQQYLDSGKGGSVCEILTYFKRPTLRFAEKDNYFVPFIHKLTDKTMAGNGNYPFYVDPTRTINTQDVALLRTYMHHFSWVRADINRKINNSSAKANIAVSNLLRDYLDPNIGPGSFVEDFRQHLVEVPNIFNIPDFYENSSINP